MSFKGLLARFQYRPPQNDSIQVELPGLLIKMTRITDPEIPHEVTVVVPRAEIREKFDENNRVIEREVLLNSITVVHAPRHPLAGPPSPPPEIPAQKATDSKKRQR
ncbi:hypothetical protein [Alkaliphilus crotonatoxidans]